MRTGGRNVVVTTTPSIDGYKVTDYLGIESVEFVIGTGVFSEIESSISDFFGARSSGFEKKRSDAKQHAMATLKFRAAEKGANAVVGIDLDYTEFSGNRIGLIINGTLVSVVPIEQVELVKPISQQHDNHATTANEAPTWTSQTVEPEEGEEANDNVMEEVSKQSSQAEEPEGDEEEQATQMFAQARQYAKNGDNEPAIATLKEIVRCYPQTQTTDKARRSLQKSGIPT